MSLWLIGMMGTGKTVAGRLAASRLAVEFHDTDTIVEERMGCSIAQFWGERGEQAFRDIEKVAVVDVARRAGIRATGGGVVLDRDNRDLIGSAPPVVWLRGKPSTLAKRLESQADRPLLADLTSPRESSLAEILEQRGPIYERLATHEIDTDSLSIEDVALKIEEAWRG